MQIANLKLYKRKSPKNWAIIESSFNNKAGDFAISQILKCMSLEVVPVSRSAYYLSNNRHELLTPTSFLMKQKS